MPYDASRDPYRSTSATQLSPGRQMSAVTASGTDFTTYPKALTCWVPVGTSSPSITVLPAGNADGATISIDLPEGRSIIDWIMVRAVTVIATGVVVRRIDD